MHEPVIVGYLRWIVFLPLLGAIINFLAGNTLQKRFGKVAISDIACAPLLLAFLLAVNGFRDLAGREPEARLLLDRLFTWIAVGNLSVDFAFQLDPLSSVMILVVTGVGGLIHLYSTAYMHDEPAYWRYFALLNLFTFAMLTLVLADNLLLMFVGWEGVGLSSFLLIGYYNEKKSASDAANKAFIVVGASVKSALRRAIM
jgi:NADH-quinone oxidoreductase subunit L